MDKLNVKTRNVERSDEIDSRLVDKIEGFRSDVDKKVRDLSEAYSESDSVDEKDLIAYRISALKCDIPEIMDFVRAYNKGLAERIEQIDIENRIVEVEHHQNANGKVDIGADNASGADNKPTDEDQQRLECSKNIKESADIGINNASDSDDESAEEQRRRNAAAKKLGNMLSKIDWANIKFDAEVTKFEKLDPVEISNAIISGKINGLNLVFLRYILCKIYDNHATEQSKQLFWAKKLKSNISIAQKSLPVLEKFSVKALEIKSKEGFGFSDKTDDELKIIDKARTLLKKVETTISNIDHINGYLLLIGCRDLGNGKVIVPDDCIGFRYELECDSRYCQNPIKLLNLNTNNPDLRLSNNKIKNILNTVNKEIELLENNVTESYKDYSNEHTKIVNSIMQMNKELASN